MFDSATVLTVTFLIVSGVVMLLVLVVSHRKTPIDARIEGLSGGGRTGFQATSGELLATGSADSRWSRMVLPSNEDGRKRLGDRLIQAGLYKNNSTIYYVTIKSFMFLIPVAIGMFASSTGVVTLTMGLAYGVIAGAFGTIAPGFWLDAQRNKRQTNLRRALPDALDIINVCLEGGLSLPGSFAKVASELRTAHPLLAAEMAIVQREIQLGQTTGTALRRMAERFDVEEIRSMASVIIQAEKFGASVVKALRIHAESLREKRKQQAEEKAQKASVKLVFPTILFIFPALMVVLVGPAAYDILEMFEVLGQVGP
jgi:tight adherence protein C